MVCRKTNRAIFHALLASIVVLSTLAATGCSREDPKAWMDSARAYVAKRDFAAAQIQLRNVLKLQHGNGEAHYLLATTLMESGDFGVAEREFRAALQAQYPPDAIYPVLARLMLGFGNFAGVSQEFAALQLQDSAAQASVDAALAYALLASGKTREAAEAYGRLLSQVPGDPRARVGIAHIAAVDGDAMRASHTVDAVLAESPNLPEGLTLKADLLISQKKPQEALTVLTTLVKQVPFDGQAHFNLISLMLSERKFDDAATAIQVMRRALPWDVRCSYLESLLAYRKGNLLKARESIWSVLSKTPDHVPSLYLAAMIDFKLGSYSTAEQNLRKVLSRSPDSMGARTLLVSVLLRKGRTDSAEAMLAPALKATPNDPELLRTAGELAFSKNRLGDAIRFYNKALEAERGNVAMWTRLAQLKLANGEVERAIDDLELASRLDRGQFQADLSLIATHLQRREYVKAMAAVAKLEEKQPDNPVSFNLKGAVLAARQDFAGARSAFDKAVSLQADYLPAIRNLAALDITERKPEAATKRFDGVLSRDPGNEGALLGLVEVLVETGAPSEAIQKLLAKAVDANPNSPSARAAQVHYLTRARKLQDAISAGLLATAAMPKEPGILAALGEAQMAAGKFLDAAMTFQELAGELAGDVVPLGNLADAQIAAKDYTGAIRTLRKALVIRPQMMEARRRIVTVLSLQGRSDEAMKEAVAIQAERPHEAIGYALQGDVLASQKKFAEAARSYAEALKRQESAELVVKELQALRGADSGPEADALAGRWIAAHPQDLQVRMYLALAAQQSKNYQEAALRYREVLGLQPQNAAVMNNLAWILGELKDPAAIGLAEQANKLAPNDPAYMDTLGWLLFTSGKNAEALPVLAKAVAAGPDKLDIRMHFAKALVRAGDKAAAEKELRAILVSAGETPLKGEAEDMLRSF